MHATVSTLEERCSGLGLKCKRQVERLLQVDTQISALGEEGLDKLHRQLQEVNTIEM
jgi:Tat protein secretion system quality control protein TatD with DNase activity